MSTLQKRPFAARALGGISARRGLAATAMASEELKAAWIARCVGTRGCGPFATMDMDWFMAHELRDPAKALARIRSAGGCGLHPLFGPPMMAPLPEDKVAIAAHDVCVVAAVEGGALVIITTLPMRPRWPFKTFNAFVKEFDPNAYRRHQRALAAARGKTHLYKARRKERPPSPRSARRGDGCG
jgi:hypothetical protein